MSWKLCPRDFQDSPGRRGGGELCFPRCVPSLEPRGLQQSTLAALEPTLGSQPILRDAARGLSGPARHREWGSGTQSPQVQGLEGSVVAGGGGWAGTAGAEDGPLAPGAWA